MAMMTGVVDVGGGMRGIYAAGILDCCMAHGVHFDCCVGVSAGSANVASYLAGQRGRNYRYYQEYALRREYMGAGNLLRTGSYINLGYVYGTLSNSGGEDPLDYCALMANPASLLVVATHAETGQARYFTKADLHQNDYRIFMASSCVPGVNRPFVLDGVPYFDGALSDPVPIEKAFSMGCDRVVLLLTKPADSFRKPGKDALLASMIQRRYPVAARQLLLRAQRYNQAVAAAKRYQAAGRALILSPSDTFGVDTLKRDKSALRLLYQAGLQDGCRILDWLEQGQ